jgi:hypothetical protein
MIQETPTVVIALACIGWLFSGARRRSKAFWPGIVLFAALLGGISGCGDGSHKSTPVVSTITITAISQNISHSTTVTLTYSH